MTSGTSDLVPGPPGGRVFPNVVTVRLGDVSPSGRARLDAVARYAQDIAADDAADAGIGSDRTTAWIVRRTVVEVTRFPAYRDRLVVVTWCSGIGSRWAERRTSVTSHRGDGRVEVGSTWVLVDVASGRPVRLPERFHDVYGEAAGGREVRARLVHPPPPDGLAGRRWAVRFTDFDVMGHVNNAAYWTVVEEELSRRRDLRAPLRAEMEYRNGIEPGVEVEIRTLDGEDGSLRLWLLARGALAASATVTPLSTQ